MDNPFIPNDKFKANGLENCWQSILEATKFDENYFSLLASKTFYLFFEYCKADAIPKKIVRLLAYMGAFAHTAKNSSDLAEGVAGAVRAALHRGVLNETT